MVDDVSNPMNAGPGAPGKDEKGGMKDTISVAIGPVLVRASMVKLTWPETARYYHPEDTSVIVESKGWIVVVKKDDTIELHDRTEMSIFIEPAENQNKGESEEVRP